MLLVFKYVHINSQCDFRMRLLVLHTNNNINKISKAFVKKYILFNPENTNSNVSLQSVVYVAD